MPIPCYVALFLALASAFCISASTTDAKLQDQILFGEFFLQVALPPGNLVRFYFRNKGTILAASGQGKMLFTPLYEVETCRAIWRRSEATFIAWDPKHDVGAYVAWWLIRPDGIYKSYDKFTWDKRAIWKH
ncbi:hypothetical protein SESBI_45827 [Sesbania bispinosa]|nr:hypothetical protein SESBI_45827 [Sesbania bispinosa]